jgi:hypothetical protein
MNSKLEEIKSQYRELSRKQNELQEQEVEKLLNSFMDLILDDRIPLEIRRESLIQSYKSSILNIFDK